MYKNKKMTKSTKKEAVVGGKQENGGVFVESKINWSFIGIMVISFVCTVAVIRLAPWVMQRLKHISQIKLFAPSGQRKVEFSGNENLVNIDPVLLKEYIDIKKQRIITIDTRSKPEYDNGHIKNAISIPLYTDFRRPYESLQDKGEWVDNVRKQIGVMNQIILYGYRPDADLLLVAADSLRKKGIRAKILSVGYGDWQGGFWSWMPGGELNGSININDYIERTNK